MDSFNEDEFSIMIASDNHLGVNEKDGIRGEDSFTTFEEILKLARDRDVDFILLGGDLFHDSKPSPQCLHKCLALLRKYCMGDRPIHVEFLSDQRTIFKNNVFPTVNYEDPNYNISLPIFSIHGNHDDPSGFGRMSALDLLSVSGLINYFGKWTDLNAIKVHPLLLKKGSSKLAIYGLSHIKDDRLYRLMKQNEVEYVLPKDHEEYFKIMVLHQNRVDRAGTNHISENLIPSFIDLVVWGHEHECRVVQEWNQEQQFYVVQTGSSVATSLCEGEAVEKKVAILKVCNQEFKLEPIPLKTVRPFVFDTVKLSDWNMKLLGNNPAEIIQQYVDRYIRSKLLKKAEDLKTDDPCQPELPLIRLRIEFEDDYECFNVIRFGQTFSGLVANPTEMVMMKRKPVVSRASRKNFNNIEESDNTQDIDVSLGDLIDQFLDGLREKSKMKVLTKTWLTEGVTRFVEKGDKEALDDIIYGEMKKTRTYLESKNANTDNLDDFMTSFHEMRLGKVKEETEEVNRLLESNSRNERDTKTSVISIKQKDILSDDEDDFGPSTVSENSMNGSKTSRGRGGRGRGSRGARTTSTRGRGGRGGSSAGFERSVADMFNISTSSTNTSRKSSTTTRSSSRNETSRYLKEQEDDEDFFGSSSHKPSPKKKMKFMFTDE